MPMKNAMKKPIFLIMILTSVAATANAAPKKTMICGTLSTISYSPAYLLKASNGVEWELNANPAQEEQLDTLAKLGPEAHLTGVCVSGEVAMMDEDKGNIFSVDSVYGEK